MTLGQGTAAWELARDVDEVHDLLLSCDAHQAAATGTAVPDRNRSTTRHRVERGQVQLLRRDGRAIASVTVSDDPPFTPPPFLAPVPGCRYISRLSVSPAELDGGGLVGLQCLRRAIEVARDSGGRVLRAEANPDLESTWRLLALAGFRQNGPVDETGRARRAYLEKALG
jgi:hypothetical protein